MNYSISIDTTSYDTVKAWLEPVYYKVPLEKEVTYKVDIFSGQMVYKFLFIDEKDIAAKKSIVDELAAKFEPYLLIAERIRELYEEDINNHNGVNVSYMEIRELCQQKNCIIKEFYSLLDEKGFMFLPEPVTNDRFGNYYLLKKY